MIGLKVSNEFLDLAPNFSIPIEWESGLFSDSFVLNGISTLPISLPFTSKNKRLLKYFHLIESESKNLQVNCQIYLDNNLWASGQLTVSISGETFDCDFSEITELALKADWDLKEILSDDEINIISAFARWWPIVGDPTSIITKVEFIVYVNNQTYTFTTPSTGVIANDMDTLYNQCIAVPDMNDLFIITRISGAEEIIRLDVIGENTIDKNLNISFDLTEGTTFANTTFGPVNDWMGYQKNEIRLAMNAKVNDLWPDSNYCFPTIWNDSFYGDKHPDQPNNFKIINYYKQGYQNNTRFSGMRHKYTISPQLFLGFVFERLGLKLNFSIDGSFTQITDLFNRLIIYNNRALDILGTDPLATINHPPLNFWKGKFITGEHLPEATLKEFLSSIRSYFQVGFFLRNGVLRIDTKKSILASSEFQDWTTKTFRIFDEIKGTFDTGFVLRFSKDSTDSKLNELLDIKGPFKGQVNSISDFPNKNVIAGEFIASKESKNLAQSSYDWSTGRLLVLWGYYCPFLHDFTYLDGTNEIDTKASQTLLDVWTETSIRAIKVPKIDQTGSSMEYGLGENRVPIRFLQYFGLQNAFKWVSGVDYVYSTDADVQYPLASMDNIDMNGNNIGDYKLRFEDSDGLFENFHKDWFDFLLRTKKLTVQIILTTTELLQLDLAKKVKLGPNLFLIEKIQTDITQNSSKLICKVDLYRL